MRSTSGLGYAYFCLPKSTCQEAEAALHYAGNQPPVLHAASAGAVNHKAEAKCYGRERAAAAQQLQTLVAVTPQLHGRAFESTARQCELQLGRRLQVVRTQAAGAEDWASGGSVQHDTHGVAELRKG